MFLSQRKPNFTKALLFLKHRKPISLWISKERIEMDLARVMEILGAKGLLAN